MITGSRRNASATRTSDRRLPTPRSNAATALAFQQAVAARWATAVADRITREPGQPGVRLRCHVDLRQALDPQTPETV
ncbi:DUF6207 family protein [Streptomyces sp. NPDC003697]